MGKISNRTSKHDRVLEIYSRLMDGEIVRKQELADEYGVAPRSIQRDIDSIRDFYSNRTANGEEFAEIKYDHISKGFRIVKGKTVKLTNAELFAISKILLENRSLAKKEVEKIISELIEACLPEAEQKKMSDLLRNELFHYVEPRHGKELVDMIWRLGKAVCLNHKIQMDYKKANGEVTKALIKPVGIMNSEFYFYLIAYVGDADQKYPGYPTIYRIDRIESYHEIGETFRVPYKNRFEEGEFRKRIPFMYGGKLNSVEFIYSGVDINAVLDKLPASEFQKMDDGCYLVKTEVFGTIGIKMWLASQGNYVKVLKPFNFLEGDKNDNY